jgi:Protein of unknown function (DUF2946)
MDSGRRATPRLNRRRPIAKCYIVTKVSEEPVKWALPHGCDTPSVMTMNWFRMRARWGSWLALLALAFQLVVSFGHIHAHEIESHIASHEIESDTHGAATDHAEPPGDAAPAHSHPDGDQSLADDCCPICALIHLTRTLVPSDAPSLPLPGTVERLQLEAAVEFDLTASDRALFRARAPPIA